MARDAFVQGMQVAAGISAVLAVIVAIVAVTLLRYVRSDPSDDGATDAAHDHPEEQRGRPEVFGTAAVAEC